MRVGFWINGITEGGGGVHQYTQRILKGIVSDIGKTDFHLVIIGDDDTLKKYQFLAHKKQVELYSLKKNGDRFQKWFNSVISLLSLRLEMFGKLNLDYRFFKKIPVDIIHFPFQTFPQHPYQFLPVASKVPKPAIVTMHDVQELHFPEYFTPLERLRRAKEYLKSITFAERIVVSYPHVKRDLIKYFDVKDSSIYVCRIPIKQVELDIPNTNKAKQFQKKYESYCPYVLYPAKTWPHKNHIALLKAVKELRSQGIDIHLICTGQKSEYFDQVLQPLIFELDLEKVVRFTGIVDEDELYWLYNNTRLVAIPTKYEAGSFPLMEAMSIGAPVVCSNVTSLSSTIADDSYTFDPNDLKDMVGQMERLIKDKQVRKMNIKLNKAKIEDLRSYNASSDYFHLWNNICKNITR